MQDDLEAPPDAERKRQILRDVAAYRELCRRVAKSGTHSLLFGALMLFLWYTQFGVGRQRNNALQLFSLIYLATACLELVVGLLNRFRPSAEGVLFDGLLLVVFGASTVARQYLAWNGVVRAGGGPWLILYVTLGVMWILQGIRHVRGYAALRRQFVERPTTAHMRWFEDLLRDITDSDPESDPLALDLPSKPRIRAKLLGDTAIFLVGGPDGLVIADRNDVEIDREPSDDPGRLPTAQLYVEGHLLGQFRLHPENWRNYAAWKAEN